MRDKQRLLDLAKQYGTPVYIYDKVLLNRAAGELLEARLPYGLTVRYAAKANPHPEIVRIFDVRGLHFDASSAYEAEELIKLGVEGKKISLSGQTLEGPLREMLRKGVLPVATSMRQLE